MVARRQARKVRGMTAPNLHPEPATEQTTKLFEPGGQIPVPGSFPAAARPPRQVQASFWLWLRRRRRGRRTPWRGAFPAAARPPRQVQASFWLWLVAVAAGLFETTLVVIDATAGEVGSAAEVAVGVAVRLLASTTLMYLAIRLRQGRNWARLALALLYGG